MSCLVGGRVVPCEAAEQMFSSLPYDPDVLEHSNSFCFPPSLHFAINIKICICIYTLMSIVWRRRIRLVALTTFNNYYAELLHPLLQQLHPSHLVHWTPYAQVAGRSSISSLRDFRMCTRETKKAMYRIVLRIL